LDANDVNSTHDAIVDCSGCSTCHRKNHQNLHWKIFWKRGKI